MDVHLQKEEVAGLYRAKLIDAQQLLSRECEKMNIEGFEVDADGKRREEKREVRVHDFVPHEPAYYEHLFQAINQSINFFHNRKSIVIPIWITMLFYETTSFSFSSVSVCCILR